MMVPLRALGPPFPGAGRDRQWRSHIGGAQHHTAGPQTVVARLACCGGSVCSGLWELLRGEQHFSSP